MEIPFLQNTNQKTELDSTDLEDTRRSLTRLIRYLYTTAGYNISVNIFHNEYELKLTNSLSHISIGQITKISLILPHNLIVKELNGYKPTEILRFFGVQYFFMSTIPSTIARIVITPAGIKKYVNINPLNWDEK